MEETGYLQDASRLPKLLDQIRAEIRLRHFSYCTWVKGDGKGGRP